jgi:DNA repair protein RadD
MSNPVTLRPYQERGVEQIRAQFAAGASRVCYQLPTGAGKTIVFCYVAPAIAFCVDIDHSRRVANAFCNEGWRACYVDGTTPRDERRDMIASLSDGRLDILTNCGLISEGLDIPGVTAAILLRPTMSRALYLQQVGRAMRPGKPKALILDHAACALRHRLPDAPYVWSLAGQQANEAEAPARQCEACGAFNSREHDHCANCVAALVVHRPPPENEPRFCPEIASELMELHGNESAWLADAPFGEAIRWAGRDRQRLYQVARARGYKPGWVHYRLKEAAQ